MLNYFRMPKSCLPKRQYKAVNRLEFEDDTDKSSEETEPLSGEKFAAQQRFRSKGRQRIQYLIIGLAIILITITVIAVKFRIKKPPMYTKEEWEKMTHVSSPSKLNDKPHLCGTTAAEARARGCTFHQLMWSWLPPGCPAYTNEEFLKAPELLKDRPWMYYEDLEGTKTLDNEHWEMLLNGDLRIITERREHAAHCVYMFLALAQVVHDGTPYPSKLTRFSHYKHCAEMMLDTMRTSDDWYAIDTMSTPVYFDMYCVEPKWLASNDTGLL